MTLKRIFCLTLSLLLALALFAGCKKDEGTVSSKASSSQVSSIVKENTEVIDDYQEKEDPHIPQTKDLGGFEMTFATPSPKKIIPEEGSSAEGDLILEALRKTQDAYHCTITVREVEQDGWNAAMTEILAGEEFANVMMPCVHQSGAFLQARLCADYLDPKISQYIDMSEPWWNDTMAYASNVLGSVYAGAPCIDSPADATYVVYFNQRILKDIGTDPADLYKMWDDKQWTWDAFVKLAKKANKDLDGSGAVDSINDRWGYVAPGYDSAQAFCSSAKVASITTENGMNPKYTFNTPHALATMEKLNQLFTTDNIYCLESWDNNNRTYEKMFTEGRALFWTTGLGSMTRDSMREMSDDFGLLTYPLGPDETSKTGWQEKYMSRVDHNFRLCIIPSTVSDLASTALVLESMAFNYWKIINNKIETYSSLYGRDDKTVEIAGMVYNTSTFEISQFLYSINNYAWNAQVETRIRDLINNANFDVSGAVNSVAEAAQTMIDDYFKGL